MITSEQITLIWQAVMSKWSTYQIPNHLSKPHLLLYLGDIAAYLNGDRLNPPALPEGLSAEQQADIDFAINLAQTGQPISFGGTVRYALIQNGVVSGFLSLDTVPTVPGFDAIPTYGQRIEAGFLYDSQTNTFSPLPALKNRWEKFFKANQTLLMDLLGQGVEMVATTALMMEFKSDVVDLEDLSSYWNRTISPTFAMEGSLLTAEAIATLNASAALHHLPVRLSEVGHMTTTSP